MYSALRAEVLTPEGFGLLISVRLPVAELRVMLAGLSKFSKENS